MQKIKLSNYTAHGVRCAFPWGYIQHTCKNNTLDFWI